MNNHLKNIFNHQTRTVTSAAFILGMATVAAAVLGFLADRLLLAKFGASDELDAYYAAFRIPDFISTLIIMGAISGAIIPVFSQYLVHSQKEVFRFLSNLFNLFLFSLALICGVLIIFTPQLLSFVVPGFSAQKKELAVLLTRLMFIGPIILGLSNMVSAILRVFRRFLITSISPLMANIGVILGIIFFVPRWGIIGVAFGVILGAFLHFLIQIPSLLQVGFRPRKIFDFRHPGFIKVVKLTIPRSIGLLANEINMIVITAIASTLAKGSITVFQVAENLSRPLYTFIAVSLAMAAFPSLSLAFSKNNKVKFKQIFSSTFSRILLSVLPLSFLLFVFRDFVVKILFQVGKFGAVDASLTAACLGMFCLGVFGQGLGLLLTKGFYAVQDTLTPSLVGIFTVIVNIVSCLFFVRLLSSQTPVWHFFINFLNLSPSARIEVIALPLSTSFASIFDFLVLLLFFWRKAASFLRNE